MHTTQHSLVRMSQRGLTKQLIDLVFRFGTDQNDKLILNKKLAQEAVKELDKMRKGLLKVIDKGGVTIVMSDDVLITAYNTNSYRK